MRLVALALLILSAHQLTYALDLHPQIVAYNGDLILQVDSSHDVAVQMGSEEPLSLRAMKTALDSLAARLTAQESKMVDVAGTLKTLSAKVDADTADLAGYKTVMEARLSGLANSILDEASVARANEARNANFTTSVLGVVTSLSAAHANLTGDHDITRSLAETLESELSQLRGETQTSIQATGNAVTAEASRAVSAEASLAKKIGDDLNSLKANQDSERSTALAALEAKIAAKPVAIAPMGELLGELAIESAGYCSGNYVRVWKDGKLIKWSEQHRGINVAWFDGNTLELKGTVAFDTNADQYEGDASAALGAYIFAIPDGDIVLAGVLDEATGASADANFFKDTRSALESIGARLWPQVKYRESYAIIGRKNAAPGTGFVLEDTGTADATDPIGDFSSGCTFRSRPTRILRMQYFKGVGGIVTAQAAPAVRDTLSDLRALSAFHTANASDVVTIEAQSGAQCDGNFVNVWINGAMIPWAEQGRGMNLAIIDPETFNVTFTGYYDTHGDQPSKSWPAGTNAGVGLASKILDQPLGTIIVVGIIDQGVGGVAGIDWCDANNNCNGKLGIDGLRALEMCGTYLLREINYRESWMFIGRRGGASAGMITEDHGKAQTNANAACGGGGRPTQKIKQLLLRPKKI